MREGFGVGRSRLITLPVTCLCGSFSLTLAPTLNISAPSALWPLANTPPVSLFMTPAQLYPHNWGLIWSVHNFEGAVRDWGV